MASALEKENAFVLLFCPEPVLANQSVLHRKGVFPRTAAHRKLVPAVLIVDVE
jgi:hypothetical protein